MSVEVYDCMGGNTLFTISVPVSEIAQYVDLVKAHGVEDVEGNEYKFNDAKLHNGGFIVYVENA